MLSLEDALTLVSERGRLMQALPSGGMAAVMASEITIRDLLEAKKARLSIAAVNGPQTTVVSGRSDDVRAFTRHLEARGIRSTPLAVSHAFHSALMEPMLDAFGEAARSISWQPPRIPIVSNLTGRVVEGALDAGYWRDHVLQAVRFADGVQSLHTMGIRSYLEVGPGSAFLAAGRSTLPEAGATWIASLGRQQPEWRSVLEALQQLYMSGRDIDWRNVHRGATHRRRSLPTYPFQGKQYWLDTASVAPAARPSEVRAVHPLLGTRVAAPPGELVFESSPLGPDAALLRDHRIGGAVVLPLAAALDAALTAGAEVLGSAAVAVEEVVYQEAVVVSEGPPRRLRTTLMVKGSERAEFRMTASVPEGQAWPIHLAGHVSRHVARPGRLRCPSPTSAGRPVQSARYYAALERLGISYGPSFRGIRRLWQGRREAFGEILLPADVARGNHQLHPAFLDACLHLYPAAIGEAPGARQGATYLPTGVTRFHVQRGIDEGWAHAVRRDEGSDDEIRVVDIRIYDKDARPVALVEGLTLRRLDPFDLVRATRSQAEQLYRVRWEQREREPAPPSGQPGEQRPWLVFSDRGGVGRALAERFRKTRRRSFVVSHGARFSRPSADQWIIDARRPGDIDRLLSEITASGCASIEGVAYLWSVDSPEARALTPARLEDAERVGCGGALLAYQALCRTRASGFLPGRLWLVTRNAQDIGLTEAATGVAQAP